MKFPLTFLLLISVSLAANASSRSHESESMQGKLTHIEANGRSSHPNQRPTVISEKEVNAYLASDYVKLPAGVKSVELEGEDGVVTGRTEVDFDRIREGVHSSNPLLSMFTGTHQVVVVTHARGEARQGYVHVDTVSIDGVEVPRFILELFVEKFLQPKYPYLGLDSQFELPDRIDNARVGPHQLTIVQK